MNVRSRHSRCKRLTYDHDGGPVAGFVLVTVALLMIQHI